MNAATHPTSRRRHRRRPRRPRRRRASRRARHRAAGPGGRRTRRRDACANGAMSGVFSPWRYNIDAAGAPAARARAAGSAPDDDALPTGGEIVRDYLAPLAALPAIAPDLKLGARVTGDHAAQGRDKVPTRAATKRPSWSAIATARGEQRVSARAVIDASGTWTQPNPIGVDGLPVAGRAAAAPTASPTASPTCSGATARPMPGKRTLVVGGGHSAINVALALMELQESDPDTRDPLGAAARRVERLLGGGLNDQLPERGALGLAARRRSMQDGRLNMLAPFSVERIDATADGARGRRRRSAASRSARGRPDRRRDRLPAGSVLPRASCASSSIPAVEAPPALAPLIDPNLHSCGTVPPHGIASCRIPSRASTSSARRATAARRPS